MTRKGRDEALGPAAPEFPDQDGALVYGKNYKRQAASYKQQALDNW